MRLLAHFLLFLIPIIGYGQDNYEAFLARFPLKTAIVFQNQYPLHHSTDSVNYDLLDENQYSYYLCPTFNYDCFEKEHQSGGQYHPLYKIDKKDYFIVAFIRSFDAVRSQYTMITINKKTKLVMARLVLYDGMPCLYYIFSSGNQTEFQTQEASKITYAPNIHMDENFFDVAVNIRHFKFRSDGLLLVTKQDRSIKKGFCDRKTLFFGYSD